jgi:hypothetical protein
MLLMSNRTRHILAGIHPFGNRMNGDARFVKGSVKRADWWDTATPYHYVRLEEQGDNDILVVGGEDHPTGMKPHEYYDAWARLEAWARQRWPMAGEVAYKWTGQASSSIEGSLASQEVQK